MNDKVKILTHEELTQMTLYIMKIYDTTELKTETFADVTKSIREYAEKHKITTPITLLSK